MSYRDSERDLLRRIEQLERDLRMLRTAGAFPPDPGWVLRDVDDGLHYIYIPTGAVGPKIGSR